VARLIGLVLAGGAGRRLGAPKGALRPGGAESLAERAAAVLEPLCRDVRISIAPGSANPAPDHPAI
jgi:molybdopterin-guanine dinucleotide biosynthesis protein A